jgi:hypothetical protein
MTATAAEPTTGTRQSLLVPMMDFPREFEDETNLWFDCDHVPDRLSCEGITAAQRFQLTDVEPVGWSPTQRWTKYLHFYWLTSIDVLSSPAYDLQREMNEGRGSLWRQLREARQAAAGRTSPVRSLRTSWVQRDDPWGGRRPIDVPEPRVAFVQLRHDQGDANDAANEFIDNTLVPELLMTAGFLSCQRFEAAEALVGSAPVAGTFRHPAYMDVYDVTTPEVLTSGTYRRYLSSLKLDPALKAALTPVGSGVYLQRPSPWRATVR